LVLSFLLVPALGLPRAEDGQSARADEKLSEALQNLTRIVGEYSGADKDLVAAINALSEKLKGQAKDKADLIAAVAALDQALEPLRDKESDAYGQGLVTSLQAWIDQRDNESRRPATWAMTKGLGQKILRLPNPLEQNSELVALSIKALDLPLTDAERQKLVTDIGPLTAKLNKLMRDRRQIHIVSATFGDHASGRVCDATAYFQGQCEQESKCPGDNVEISGQEVCGYDPAPTAGGDVKLALIRYSCTNFDLRDWDEIVATETVAPRVAKITGKGKIFCNPIK
jgi:hypothetical protein